MTRPAMMPTEDDDATMRLADAVAVAFPHGGMTVSGLRTEARAGRLAIERIAGKDYTTIRAIRDMRAACRVQRVLDSGLDQPGQSAAKKPCGLSETAESSVRLASASMTLEALKKPSQTTLPASTIRRSKGAEIRSLPDCRTLSASRRGKSRTSTPAQKKPDEGSPPC